MLLFLETVNVIAILLMLFMLSVILRQQPSKAQMAFALYDVFTMIFVIGLQLELVWSDTIGEALPGLCVQYVGQAGFLMALLWFISEFARFHIPKWVYMLQALCNALVLTGVFTAEKHPYFYSSMEILTDGMYHRIEVTGGILWRLHYAHMTVVLLAILLLCALRYRKSTHIQKRRITYIAAGIGVFILELILKGIGVFGSYNPVVLAMTITMFCMMMAMVRYRYFGSLHAAVDNAFNHGSEGLLILDHEGAIIFVNHRMDELFPDIRQGDIIDSYPELLTLLQDEEHLLHREDTVYELRTEEIIENGENNGRMLWLIDQTESLQTMRKLKEADEAKTQFLMRVSHELRTPMNTMLGMNEMILRESSENSIRSYAVEVAGAGEHMMALINEVLDAARLEDGRLTIAHEPYRIGEVLDRAEELMRPQAQEKGLQFYSCKEFPPMYRQKYLMGDAVHLRQAVVNLLSNAMKYTDKGFVQLSAGVKSKNGQTRLWIAVKDSGIGIRREDLSQIFENFERGRNTGGKEGMGLGLAIVKRLVETMEGTLTVESILGKGSTFTIEIPWVEASRKEQALWKLDGETLESVETTQTLQNVTMQNVPQDIPDLSKKTILAVDDNAYNLKVLKYLLKRTKAVVWTAGSGKEALRMCREKMFDLIFMDHMMQGMDGIETFHQLKTDADGKNAGTIVIVLTANAGEEARLFYEKEGFDGYLAKPIEPKRLEEMLTKHLYTKQNAVQRGDKEQKEDGGNWLELLKNAGIQTDSGLRYANDDPDFYWEILTMFQEQYGEHKEKLISLSENLDTIGEWTEAEREGFFKKWIVVCHGLKGEARGIGAESLGEWFYRMELAGREENSDELKKLLPDLLTEWEYVVKQIQKYITT